MTAGPAAGFNLNTQAIGHEFEQKVNFMTALAAKFEADNADNNARLQALAMLFGLTFALLPLLALNGTLLLRLP